MKRLFITIISVSMVVSSCMTTKTSIGTYDTATGEVYTYDKGKQFWLFWGIIPIGRTNTDTPESGICQITTKHKAIDVFISFLTVGIVKSHSIEVKAKK